MKIAFFGIKGWEKPIIKKSLKGHKLEFFKESLTLDNVNKIKSFDAISVFIYSEINKKILNKLPKLKLITTRSTGYDHIDIKECKKRKIAVCNVPTYGENTVAEHTFALILACSRNVHKSYVRTLKNDYSITGLQGFDLKGKTIGIIGAGHIGQHVIKIAKGFGMEVLAYDMHQNRFLSEVLDFEYVDFDFLLKKSDIISLHCPLTKDTKHIINSKSIAKIKKGAILINTARGDLVDTEAVIKGLDKKILSAVGLDVIEGENLIKEEKELLYDKTTAEQLQQIAEDHILLSRDNVVYTPHIAFYSKEALERIIHTTIEIILGFKNKKCINMCTY